MPLFSIIIPVYNVEKYINQCVDSVLKQTFSDYEIILVDDGSPDKCPAICDKYAETDLRIKVIHKSNGGASDSRNVGMENAKGKYIVFLDSDDLWIDEKALEELNSKISETPSDVILFGCTDYLIDKQISVVTRNNYELSVFEKDKSQILHYLLSNKLLPGGPTVFCFKKELIDRNGISFKTGIQDEDYDFVLSIFVNAESFNAVNNPFYQYNIGRSASVTTTSSVKMVQGIEYTIEKWFKLCDTIEDGQLKKDILNYLAFIYATGFVICGRMNRKDRNEALKRMKPYEYILKYGYWKKTRITKYAIKVIGRKTFSVLSSRYFDLKRFS